MVREPCDNPAKVKKDLHFCCFDCLLNYYHLEEQCEQDKKEQAALGVTTLG